MTTKTKNPTRWLALGPILFINFLFAWKYGSRATDLAPLIAFALVAAQISWVMLSERLLIKERWLKWLSILASLTLLLVVGIVNWKIPLESLNVDRWSVIASFWKAVGVGDYPYFARSHMGNPPGPMPVYFLIAWPFWASGGLAPLAAAGYLLLFIGWRKRKRSALVVIPLLLSCTFVYWEVAVRSNIFSYSVLVLLALEYFRTLSDKKWSRTLVILSMSIGLLLSTRSVFALAYVVYFLGLLKVGEVPLGRLMGFGLSAALAFGLTFLPFLLIWGDVFWEMNPFLVQSSFLLPVWFLPGFFLLAAGSVLGVNRSEDIPLVTGLVLFGCILIYASYHVFTAGFAEAFFGSKVDLSYFLLAVPFLLVCITRCLVKPPETSPLSSGEGPGERFS